MRQSLRTALIALQQVISHALRRFRPDAREAAQGLDQVVEAGGRFHRFKERKLETRRQIQAGGETGHLFLGSLFDAAHRIVHRRGHQVFQHFLVVAHQAVDRC